MCLYSGLSGRNFLACLHEETNSFRLFSVANSSLHMIKYFSQRQWLHLLIAQLYDLVRFKFFHIILNSIIHRLAKLTLPLDKHSYLLTSNILLIIVYVNTVKISYSRMPNVKKAADGHNKSKLSQTSTSDANTCNCRNNTPWIDKVCSNP